MRAFYRNLIRRLTKENFSAILSHSLGNCHVKGFNSIFLLRNEALSLRLYVCRPGETALHKGLDPNDPTLWIHNHRFYFQCQTLLGWMENLTYSESASPTDQGVWNKYRYQSALAANSNQARLICEGQVNLSLDKVHRVGADEFYAFEADQLHRIVVPNDEYVIMLFWEHARVENIPYAYTKESLPETPCMTGLYTPYTEAALRALIDEVLEKLA